MNRAVRVTATLLGLSAGIAAVEHGYFEWMQGSIDPGGLFIASIGPPCLPEATWNRCEPALTIVPNLAITGILAMLLGLASVFWSLFFIQRKRGGLVLILLSIAMLLFGGGIFPPLIGTVAGLTGTRINHSLAWWQERAGESYARFLAGLYPWALAVYLALVLGQWVVGYFFNDWLMANMGTNVLLILVSLLLSTLSAFAHDAGQPGVHGEQEQTQCARRNL